MSDRREYHVLARIDGDRVRVSALLGPQRRNTPSLTLSFQPVKSETNIYPIAVYWNGESLPTDVTGIECAAVEYCTRLYHEAPYAGPIDCCL